MPVWNDLMQCQFLQSFGGVLLACAVALPLASCSKNEEQKAEIESLRQEVQDREANLAAIQSRSQDLERKNSELNDKANEAESKTRQLESQLNQAKAELDALQKAKTAEVAKTASATPSQSLETTKNQLTKQFPAILLIEGDVSSGRGTVIQADGKTWLYSAPHVLSGNSKVTIKGADGTALTQLGAFQIAADSNLVRFEIQQEMPVKLEFDATATVDATTRLVAADAGPNNAALQVVECSAARTTGNDFEFDGNSNPQSYGCPLLSAQSAKVIGIISPGPAAATTVWPDTQQAIASTQTNRAARLNRPIDWKASTLGAFFNERRKIDDLNKTTRLLHALAGVQVVGVALQLEGPLGGNTTVRKVLEQNASLPMVVELMKIQADLAGKKVGIAPRDIKRRIASILSQAKATSARQVQDLKGIAFSSYHRPAAELALKWRGEADQAVNTSLNNFSR